MYDVTEIDLIWSVIVKSTYTKKDNNPMKTFESKTSCSFMANNWYGISFPCTFPMNPNRKFVADEHFVCLWDISNYLFHQHFAKACANYWGNKFRQLLALFFLFVRETVVAKGYIYHLSKRYIIVRNGK